MGKTKAKKRVRFTHGRTSPNDTQVPLAEDKNTAKTGIDTPAVGYSGTHFITEDESNVAFGKAREFADARKEAIKLGEIGANSGNIQGEHAHTKVVRANTRFNANIAKDVKRASARRAGTGFKKRRYTKKNRK